VVDLLPVGGADAEWDLFLMRGAREAREHLPFINYSRDGGESQGTHGDFKETTRFLLWAVWEWRQRCCRAGLERLPRLAKLHFCCSRGGEYRAERGKEEEAKGQRKLPLTHVTRRTFLSHFVYNRHR